ncbi:MAG: DUF4339 domain-containing protein [Pirellulales bacterium]|nr:DUF4339 domain-containing protein [Pirellulales bacterium]
MGIKFRCPNGHKMNVKSFLAGKKGICPKCGVGVEVPLASEGEALLSSSPAAASKVASSATEAISAEDAEVPSLGAIVGAEIENAISAVEVGNSNGKVAGRSTATMPSVIAQEPLAIWYACTQLGDRYGPVSGEVLNEWLGQGRVAAGSLVWREGWPEWRKASVVFPNLNPATALADLFPGSTPTAPVVTTPTTEQPKMDDLLADALAGATTTATTYISTSRRRSYKDKLVLMSMVLIGAAILLGVTLMLVLLNQK